MCEIMDRITKKEREEATIAANLKAIKNIMSNFDLSAKKVMQGMGLDEQEQEKYLRLLGLKQ